VVKSCFEIGPQYFSFGVSIRGLKIQSSLKNCDFPMKIGGFPMKNGDFPMKVGDFSMKNGDFPMKHIETTNNFWDFQDQHTDPHQVA